MRRMPEIIFDTNVLSNFAISGELTLLQAMYHHTARCSGHVSAEVQAGFHAGHTGLRQLSEMLLDGWPPEEHCDSFEERRLLNVLSVSLGKGESSCIALAACRGYVFACDDRLARREAERLGVPLSGTVGILIKAIRIGEIELAKANAVLKVMIQAGFYSPVARITREMVV